VIDHDTAGVPRVYRATLLGNVALLRWHGVPSVIQNELLMRDLRLMRQSIGDRPAIAACVVTPEVPPPDAALLAAIEIYRGEFLTLFDSLHVVLEAPREVPEPLLLRQFTAVAAAFAGWARDPDGGRLCINSSLTDALARAAVPCDWPIARVVTEARAAGFVRATHGRDALPVV